MDEELRSRNPILRDARDTIEWERGVDTDSSKFEGVNFQVPDEVYYMKWRITGNAYRGQSGMNAQYDFHMEFRLMKEEEGTMRDFKADLEVIYAAEWHLKGGVSFFTTIFQQ